MADYTLSGINTNWTANALLANPYFAWVDNLSDLSIPPTGFLFVSNPDSLKLERAEELVLNYTLTHQHTGNALGGYDELLKREDRFSLPSKTGFNNVVGAFKYLPTQSQVIHEADYANAAETPLVHLGSDFNSYGNRVWFDANRDHLQNYQDGKPLEFGLRDVTVNLYRTNEQGQLLATPASPAATTTTDDNGAYFFRRLPAGFYRSEFLLPGHGRTPFTLSTGFVGGDFTFCFFF